MWPAAKAQSLPEQNSVYVMGVFDDTRFGLDTLALDESSFALLNERRCYINAPRLNATHISASGSYYNAIQMAVSKALDLRRNRWTTIAPINVVRSDAHGVELDGKGCILGGFDGSTCQRSLEYYDPQHNQWTMLQQEMREKRSGVSALAIHGALFAVGGFTGRQRLATAEFWDPREGHWHSVSSMILNRSHFDISELRPDPVSIGGYDGHGTTEMCEQFDWSCQCPALMT